MRYLTESHLELWRKTIFLFRKQKNQSGPFANCGYTQFIIEYQTKSNEIDIIAWNPAKPNSTIPYYALELTTDPNADKNEQLKTYSQIDSMDFFRAGIQSEFSPIAVLITPFYIDNHNSYCQLELTDSVTAYNLDRLENPHLKNELSKSIDLTHSPQTSFTIVPESKNVELRQGIIDSLMSVFGPKYESFTAEEITDLALDYISDKIDLKKKKILIKRVNTMLYALSQNQLKEYLTFQDGKYTPTEKGRKVITHSNSREALLSRLEEWAKNTNTTLDRWIIETD